jgi:hypothetical protein
VLKLILPPRNPGSTEKEGAEADLREKGFAMKAAKLGMTIGLATVATAALALPTFIKDFETFYKIDDKSALKKETCNICHVGKTPKFNPYGQDIKKIWAELKVKKFTADVAKKLDDLDSDKDGVKNGDEIKKGTLPGDPKSK